MRLLYHLNDYGPAIHPVVLTIGTFDGVHRGHQRVIAKVVETAKEIDGRAVVITFENHPSEVLTPEHPITPLCRPQHKARLLEMLAVDAVFLLPFTKEFSEQRAETFLQQLQKKIPFTHLILGHDASIGKDRKGDRYTVMELSYTMGFHVNYLEQAEDEESHISFSSSGIRKLIREGNFIQASKLLGREYSIVETVIPGSQNGSRIGYPTANLDVAGLCLPPFGVYAVNVMYQKRFYKGIANLGIAPTVRVHSNPILEVYFFKPVENLYGKEVEVFFMSFIRPEKKFSSVDALKKQITQDIASATRAHSRS